MSDRDLLLGVDFGSGGCKVTLIDTAGHLAGESSVEYRTWYEHPGWAEQEPGDWYEAMCAALARVRASGVDFRRIAALAFDGSTHNAVLLDGAMKPLRRTIMWTDQRSTAECAELEAEAWRTHLCDRLPASDADLDVAAAALALEARAGGAAPDQAHPLRQGLRPLSGDRRRRDRPHRGAGNALLRYEEARLVGGAGRSGGDLLRGAAGAGQSGRPGRGSDSGSRRTDRDSGRNSGDLRQFRLPPPRITAPERSIRATRSSSWPPPETSNVMTAEAHPHPQTLTYSHIVPGMWYTVSATQRGGGLPALVPRPLLRGGEDPGGEARHQELRTDGPPGRGQVRSGRMESSSTPTCRGSAAPTGIRACAAASSVSEWGAAAATCSGRCSKAWRSACATAGG